MDTAADVLVIIGIAVIAAGLYLILPALLAVWLGAVLLTVGLLWSR